MCNNGNDNLDKEGESYLYNAPSHPAGNAYFIHFIHDLDSWQRTCASEKPVFMMRCRSSSAAALLGAQIRMRGLGAVLRTLHSTDTMNVAIGTSFDMLPCR